MSFFECRKDNRVYLKSDTLDFDGKTCHAFTTKLGGVSHGKIEGLNLGFRVNDDEESVRENYRLLASDLGLEMGSIVLSKQTHTDNIRIVTKEDAGKGITKHSDIEETDGLVTNIRGIALVVFSADCVPILMYDWRAGVVAAVHAGWRGSVAGIAPKCAELMQSRFGSRAEDIRVAIGPSIGKCCFEFGEEAVIYFDDKYYEKEVDGRFKVDLWEYNKDLLTNVGVKSEHIDISGICTMCRSDKFYSYRAHRERTGRLGAVIMLRG